MGVGVAREALRHVSLILCLIHTPDVTQLDSCVTSAVCIGLYRITSNWPVVSHGGSRSQARRERGKGGSFPWPRDVWGPAIA